MKSVHVNPIKLLLYLLVVESTSKAFEVDELENLKCMYKMTSKNLSGDIILGGVFPLQNFKVTDYIYDTKAITWVESFLLAIDQINKNPNLLPDVKLGYDIRNSCGNQELALQHTLDFMINSDYYEPADSKNSTNTSYFGNAVNRSLSNMTDQVCVCEDNMKHKVAVVIGDYTSQLSESMSNLLSTDYLPQISYGATSPTLGNKTIYRSFLRTLPSDLYQTKAIADLLYKYNWTYVSALASDDDYGRAALDKLRDEMKAKGMCLALDRTFDPRFPGSDLEIIIQNIRKHQDKTNVVILWCNVIPAERIITAALAAGLTNIIWIGAEQWGTDSTFLDLKNLSLISLKLRDESVPELTGHVKSLSRESKFQNPWLEPFWVSVGYCPKDQTAGPNNCFPGEPDGSILPFDKHYSVMASVYAAAYGLHRLFNCQTKNGTRKCPNRMKPLDYKLLIEHIKNASFTIPSTTSKFVFDQNGDAAFSSFLFQVIVQKSNRKEFQTIGNWNGIDKSIEIYKYTKLWSNNNTKVTATCSYPCQPGFFIIHSPVSCCWECVRCPVDEVSTNVNQRKCQKCQFTQISNAEHNKCIELNNMNLTMRNSLGLALAGITLLGVVLTTMTLLIFVRHWNTPIVKSSSREMSIIQILSIGLLFCFPFLYMTRTTTITCVARTMFFGLLYAQIIAFIVIKTYRLLRVFNKKRLTKISKYLHTKYQLLASFTIVFIELIVLTICFLVNTPQFSVYRDKTKESYINYCGSSEDMINYIVIGYLFFLSLVSGFMAFKARSLPENFNEAQFIWFAMFTTCLAWLLFLPLYLSLDRIEKPVVVISISLVSNFCLLGFLYGYKIYIILFQPQLNTVAHFRKMATNATVTTFLKEVDSTGTRRPREQSVISFDFDAMFDEYQDRLKSPSVSLPTRKFTLKLRRSKMHFSSGKKKPVDETTPRTKQRKKNKKYSSRTATMQLPKEQRIPTIQRSLSLDERKLRRDLETLRNQANDLYLETSARIKSGTDNEINAIGKNKQDACDVFTSWKNSDFPNTSMKVSKDSCKSNSKEIAANGTTPHMNSNNGTLSLTSQSSLRNTKSVSIDSMGLFSPVSVNSMTELLPANDSDKLQPLQRRTNANGNLAFSFSGQETSL